MKPSKYRNVSGIFVELDKKNSIMLDCGEGTYYQLFNHYGIKEI
jgi:ribonuclease Z